MGAVKRCSLRPVTCGQDVSEYDLGHLSRGHGGPLQDRTDDGGGQVMDGHGGQGPVEGAWKTRAEGGRHARDGRRRRGGLPGEATWPPRPHAGSRPPRGATGTTVPPHAHALCPHPHATPAHSAPTPDVRWHFPEAANQAPLEKKPSYASQ